MQSRLMDFHTVHVNIAVLKSMAVVSQLDGGSYVSVAADLPEAVKAPEGPACRCL